MGSVIIGISFTMCVIKPGYTKINTEISAGTNEAASRYIEQKYNEIIEYNDEDSVKKYKLWYRKNLRWFNYKDSYEWKRNFCRTLSKAWRKSY